MTLNELISALEAERQEHGGDCVVQALDLHYRKPSEPGYMRRILFDAKDYAALQDIEAEQGRLPA